MKLGNSNCEDEPTGNETNLQPVVARDDNASETFLKSPKEQAVQTYLDTMEKEVNNPIFDPDMAEKKRNYMEDCIKFLDDMEKRRNA